MAASAWPRTVASPRGLHLSRLNARSSQTLLGCTYRGSTTFPAGSRRCPSQEHGNAKSPGLSLVFSLSRHSFSAEASGNVHRARSFCVSLSQAVPATHPAFCVEPEVVLGSAFMGCAVRIRRLCSRSFPRTPRRLRRLADLMSRNAQSHADRALSKLAGMGRGCFH